MAINFPDTPNIDDTYTVDGKTWVWTGITWDIQSTDSLIPDQTGNSGKYLRTDGTSTSWEAADALPSQTGNDGKYLTTNGTSPSWAVLDVSTKADLSGAIFTGDVEAPNLTITGDLFVQGTTTTINTTDYSVRDNMIYLNQAGLSTITNAVGNGSTVVYTTELPHGYSAGDDVTVTGVTPSSFDIASPGYSITAVTDVTFTVASNVTDTYVSGGQSRGKVHANPDLGFAAGRYDTVNGIGYGHAGLFRDATDAKFKFFDGYIPEPDESVFIDTAHPSFSLAPISVADIDAASINASGDISAEAITANASLEVFGGVDIEDITTTRTNLVNISGYSTVNNNTDFILENTNPTANVGSSRIFLKTKDHSYEFFTTSTTNAVQHGSFGIYDNTAGASRMRILSNGNVGFGVNEPTHKLEVAGSFAATTKSFLIDHPTKEGMRLRYGSLEGPENGVYVRGRSSSKTIELPDYWTALVDESTITVNLTPIGSNQKLFVKKIENNTVVVGGRPKDYFYTVFAERKDVPKLIVEE